MPELPDVEIFKRLVERRCLGRVIANADIVDLDSLEGESPASLQRRLKGKKLRACRRHGKVLFVEMDEVATLAMHFGTNGTLRCVAQGKQEPPCVRLGRPSHAAGSGNPCHTSPPKAAATSSPRPNTG